MPIELMPSPSSIRKFFIIVTMWRLLSNSTRQRPVAAAIYGHAFSSPASFVGASRQYHTDNLRRRRNSEPPLFFPRALPSRASAVDANVTPKQKRSTSNQTSPSILRELNPSQVQAVTQPMATVTRVVAGPGSGKTRVLTSRIAYLLQCDPQCRVLAVTFTKKAAGEMLERLRTLLEEDQTGLDRVTLGTFHSVCAKILRWNGDRLATLPSVQQDMSKSYSSNTTTLDGGFAIIDEGAQIRILRECIEEAEIDLNDHNLKIKPILTTLGRCKAKLAQGGDPFHANSTRGKDKFVSPTMQVVGMIYYQYRERLLTTNCLDFDDLIYLTRELLLTHPDVREHLQRRWPHVLVDEFQDTSRSQIDLVKLLTSSSLLVVGDADQSIYSWRGAHVTSLSDLEKEFEHHLGGVETIYLMENYRSTSNIVRAAQKVISHTSGNATSQADKLRQDMKPQRGSGPAPRIMSFEDSQAEAEFVVSQVARSVDSGNYTSDRDVAFIYRTNAQSRALEEACVKKSLPYVIFGSATSFYKRQEIKDCLCYLQWLQNGFDRVAMLRVLTTPKRGIGDVAIGEFDTYCELVEAEYNRKAPGTAIPSPLDVLLSLSGEPLLSDIPPAEETLSKRPLKLLSEFSRQLRSIRDLACRSSLEKVVGSIIDEFRLIEHVDKISKSKSEYEERKRNVEELRQATLKFHGLCMPPMEQKDDQDSPLTSFLDDVALVTDLAEKSSDQAFVVKLMTIHASKGMEFDTVFVVGNEDGTIPTSQAIGEGEESVLMEEEKRLCYVAMTRAKTELFLTWRREVVVYAANAMKMFKRERSRFLDVLVPKDKAKSEASRRRSKSQTTGAAPRDPRSSRSRKPDYPYQQRSKRQVWSATNGSRQNRKSVATPPNRAASRFEGTASVYNNRRPSPINNMNGSMRRTANPRAQEPRVLGEKTGQSGGGARRQTAATTRQVDSTWFFPVGSDVYHKFFGKGTVLPPPPHGSEGDALLVLVEFETGERETFSAKGSELRPIL